MIKTPQQNELGKHDYSVIIFQEGDYYVAEDYNGRKIKEDNTDAAKVFQAAIDELDWGGLIFVKHATYPIRSTIEFKYEKTRMVGESMGSPFLRADVGLTPMVKISDAVQYVTLEYLTLCGNNNATIVFDGSRATSAYAHMSWRECHIYGATSKNMVFTNREEVLISGCVIGQYPQTSPYNIYVNGLDGWLTLANRTVVHNATTDSIYFKGRMLSIVNSEVHTRDGASTQIRLTDGRLHMANAWIENVGVRSVIGAGTWARVTTSNGYINGGFSGAFTFIRFNGDKLSSTFTHDIDCTVSKSITGNLDMDGTINITGKYHLYDLDESVFNSNMITTGWGQGIGSAQEIAHGLATTPSRVIVWDSSVGADAAQEGASTSTHIYINAGAGKYYGWKAEV